LLHTKVCLRRRNRHTSGCKTVVDDDEMNAVVSALAGESFGSARAESMNVVPGHTSAESIEVKKRKRKLWCSSVLELEDDSAAPNLGDDAANASLEDDVESWGGARASRYITEEEEDEEDVASLVHRDHHRKASNDVPDHALSGLVSL
jgi:hypothetical protein